MRGQNITIRPETAADHDAIRQVNQEAFDLTPSRCTSGNERITRKTAVADDFPIQVVCDWIGNTEAIAAKHYLQVTDEHFSKAVRNPVLSRIRAGSISLPGRRPTVSWRPVRMPSGGCCLP